MWRFLALVQIDRETGCWQWQGSVNGPGYGLFKVSPGKRKFAHRLSHEWWLGPIPKKWVVDHLCRNHGCCNPAHLEAVTHGENIKRGWKLVKGIRPRKTGHCGHDMIGENEHLDYQGKRGCRQCILKKHRDWHRARNKRRKDEEIARMSPTHMPSAEAMRVLGISTGVMSYKIQRGLIEFVRFSKKNIWISRASVAALLEKDKAA